MVNPAHVAAASDEWVELRDEKTGRAYYWNRRTKETVWSAPEGRKVVWNGTKDASGLFYFWHRETRETCWELPAMEFPGKSIAVRRHTGALRSETLSADEPPDAWVEVVGDGLGPPYYWNYVAMTSRDKLLPGARAALSAHKIDGRYYYRRVGARSSSQDSHWDIPELQESSSEVRELREELATPLRSWLTFGVSVLIDGLSSEKRFNGQVGQVIDTRGGRCLVQLADILGGPVLSVRARHLSPLPKGAIVKLQGLSQSQLNGEIATIESNDVDLRYVVRLRDNTQKSVPRMKVLARCRLWDVNMSAPNSLQWKGEKSCLFIDAEGHHRNYFLHLPVGFYQRVKWPLLVYLHGTGGGTLFTYSKKSLKSEGLQFAARTFVVVSPACEWNWKGSPHVWVIELIRALLAAAWVDARCVYLCGWSMGGMGTWEIGAQAPDLFAAIAPVAAHHKREREATLEAQLRGTGMPVHVTHANTDETCPMSLEQPLWDKFAGDPHFVKRILPTDHCKIHADAFCANTVLFEWMLENSIDPR